jgi:UDP-N-acetylglucosamine acyltransferase
MREIHATAIIDRRAELADDVVVGAYTIIKSGVRIGPGTVIQEQCHIHGDTTIGKNCRIGPTAFVGLPPQHLKHDGNGTRLIIGNDVVIRETASVHRSINPEEGHATRLGDRVMLMAGAHVGHDCQIAEDVILANTAMLGGHVVVGPKAFLGGGAAMHQFTRVGRLAIIAGNEALSHDVPPFSAVRFLGLKGYNAIGCKRSGMPVESIHAVRQAFHCFHRHRTMPAVVEAIRKIVPQVPEVKELLDFIASTKRGILRSVNSRRGLLAGIDEGGGDNS